MLRRTNSAALVLFFCLIATQRPMKGQDAKVAEPDVIGVVHYLDGTSFVPIEHQTKTSQIKGNPLNLFGTVSHQIEVTGEKSTFRIKRDQKQEFVIQLPGGDPTRLKLYKFESQKNKKRQMVTYKISGFNPTLKDNNIGCTVTRYGQSSYRFTPSQKLAAGEYGFTASGDADIFLFGVD